MNVEDFDAYDTDGKLYRDYVDQSLHSAAKNKEFHTRFRLDHNGKELKYDPKKHNEFVNAFVSDGTAAILKKAQDAYWTGFLKAANAPMPGVQMGQPAASNYPQPMAQPQAQPGQPPQPSAPQGQQQPQNKWTAELMKVQQLNANQPRPQDMAQVIRPNTLAPQGQPVQGQPIHPQFA